MNFTHELKWWSCTLAVPNPSPCLTPLPPLDLAIWVDASTSVGIGILVNGDWEAWSLMPGWNSDGQNIGWEEAVAIELVICGSLTVVTMMSVSLSTVTTPQCSIPSGRVALITCHKMIVCLESPPVWPHHT